MVVTIAKSRLILRAKGTKEHGTANSLAAAVAGGIESDRAVHIRAMGAYAVSNAIKSVAIAQQMIDERGKLTVSLTCKPTYLKQNVSGSMRTLIDVEVMVN